MTKRNKIKKTPIIAIALALLIISLPIASAEQLNRVYDANGNLISDGKYYREYNGLNQLIKVRLGNTSSSPVAEEYVWHPIEERIVIKRVYQNGILNYTVYYPNENFVQIVNSSGTYTEKYVYQEGVLVAQINTDGQKQAIHSDHEGSNTLITDSSGNVVENSFYSPFGEIIEGGKVSRFDYEGKEYDSVVEDYDFHFRKYNPAVPIFHQPDTLIQNVYDPQSLNRYSFERNNPYKYVDKTGHQWTDPYERPRLETRPQESAGGIIGAAEEANKIHQNILQGKESSRKELLGTYSEYYKVDYALTQEGVRWGGDLTYEELKEWMITRNSNRNGFSLERRGIISTPRTASYTSFVGQSGGNFYSRLSSLGGSVAIRDQGIQRQILAVYYRTDNNGNQIWRYQYFKDKNEKKKWEKTHKEYKPPYLLRD